MRENKKIITEEGRQLGYESNQVCDRWMRRSEENNNIKRDRFS